MKIHPTAIVSPHARLGANIEIGPFTTIGDQVVIGDDCRIQSHVILEDRVTIGRENTIGHGTIIGAAPQDYSHHEGISSSVEIGDGNIIREYVTIHRGAKEGGVTRVGHKNMLMTGAHLAHDVKMGDRNTVANNVLFAGHVQIADDIVFGGGAVFHQFIRIGSMAMIRGGTNWGMDIPPYTVGVTTNRIAGLNVYALRKKGMSPATRLELKRAYKLLFMQGLNISQALEQAATVTWSPEVELLLTFARERSKRGLCRAYTRDTAGAGPDED